MALSLFVGIYIIGNKNFSGQNADEGTGIERNIIGIVNLANSKDLSEGSTLELSALLLSEKLHSPIIGNGKAYRKEYYYGRPTELYHNEGSYKVDARLAFMFVEYGIIGLLLFYFLYSSIFKGCRIYSKEKSKRFYTGIFAFFFFSSITDPGFWDYVSFSSILIYVFSKRYSPKLAKLIIK